MRIRGRIACWLLVGIWLLLYGPAAVAQPQQFAFGPDRIFENVFGKPSLEKKDAFDKIQIALGDERRFGNEMVEAFLAGLKQQKLKIIEKGPDVVYLQDLIASLRPFMTKKDRYRTIKVYLVDSPETDARSFPGGTLVFFRGLLDFAGNEAALVGVVGHELSHLEHGHQLMPLKRMKHFETAIARAQQGRQFEEMSSAFSTMADGFMRPFRPEDESEADLDGANWAFKAGYDPREFGELFLRLHQRDGVQSGQMISFLQTHPFRLDRYRDIQNQYIVLRKSSPGRTLYIGTRNLIRRTSRAKQVFPE